MQCLDVLRAILRAPQTLEAYFAEIDAARGANHALDAHAAALKDDMRDLGDFESQRARPLRSARARPAGERHGPTRLPPTPTPSALRASKAAARETGARCRRARPRSDRRARATALESAFLRQRERASSKPVTDDTERPGPARPEKGKRDARRPVPRIPLSRRRLARAQRRRNSLDRVQISGQGDLPSAFAVTDLAAAVPASLSAPVRRGICRSPASRRCWRTSGLRRRRFRA